MLMQRPPWARVRVREAEHLPAEESRAEVLNGSWWMDVFRLSIRPKYEWKKNNVERIHMEEWICRKWFSRFRYFIVLLHDRINL